MCRVFQLVGLCMSVMLGIGCVDAFTNMGSSSAASKPQSAANHTFEQSDTPDYSAFSALLNLENGYTITVPAGVPSRRTGSIRLYGILKPEDNDPLENTTMADFGLTGRKNWFFADIEPRTGKILFARAFLNNVRCEVPVAFDSSQPLKGSYGKITKNSWEIMLEGPMQAYIHPTSRINFLAIKIKGTGNLLTMQNGTEVTGKFIWSGMADGIGPSWSSPDEVFHGIIIAKIVR